MPTTPIQRLLFAQGGNCFFCSHKLTKAEASVEHGGFCLTPKGEDILFGREEIALRADPFAERRSRRTERDAARADGLDEGTAGLFEHLRNLRFAFAQTRIARIQVQSPSFNIRLHWSIAE